MIWYETGMFLTMKGASYVPIETYPKTGGYSMNCKVRSVRAMEILDSRGNPTLRAFVVLDNGLSVSASVPSGASTGEHEAVELRDGDGERYGGKGGLEAGGKVK